MPFLLQNGILVCVLIEGITIGIIDKGHELPEEALPAHTQFLAEVLRRQVVVLGVGIDPPGTLLIEEIVEEGPRRFICVALSVIVRVQHPAGTEGVLHIVFRHIQLRAFGMGIDLINGLASIL